MTNASGVVAPELDRAIGAELYDAARRAYSDGRSVWSCVITVAVFGEGPRWFDRPGHTQARTSTDELVNAVEGLGWRLEHVDHVYVPAHVSAAGTTGADTTVSGHTDAHYTFRRALERDEAPTA
ncbi:hypothetical protein KQI48_00680 [Cellulomonas hominis]|jgi:hypothetical protein|uniref:hypothetical protein n=1 Tax=Cellulomonas hominis TaxID=156981 RepID=UPI001982CB48|nr:hypothetical protein [Cellulomonas hominis]MBD3777720.1 hypothetical protein [Micrococcales bacterium]MBU5421169.1 hypothetical protein [Cellulomonas hominis]